MWWDWAEITLFESVLFSTISVFILYLVGFGILGLISIVSKKSDPFEGFDFLQKINYRILFGFILVYFFYYVFSFLNLSIFSAWLIICLSLIGAVARYNAIRNWIKKPLLSINYYSLLSIVIVAISIIFLSMLAAGFYGSTIDDGADHTLMTRVVLENPVSLLTRSAQPLANFTLNYPSGSHVLSAFLVSLLNVQIQKIIILISVVLPLLIAFAFYSTLKCLFKSKPLSILGLAITSFFTIGFTWWPIGWGGLPVLLSLYLAISSMGLIFFFLLKQKLTWLNAFLLGLIFFISSQTYPTALLIASLWLFVILITKLAREAWHIHLLKTPVRPIIKAKSLALVVPFLIPILFSVPYFYTIYISSIAGIQFNELNPASSLLADSVKGRISFNWLFDIPSLSVFYSELGILFSLAPYVIFIIISFLIPFLGKKLRNLFPTGFATSLLLVYIFRMAILIYLAITLFLPINFLTDIFNPERVWQHIFIVATIMTIIVIFFFVNLSYLTIKRISKIGKRSTTKKSSRNRLLVVALSVLSISTLLILCVPVVLEQHQTYNGIRYYLNYYTILGPDDLSLMNWIKYNIPSQELILISRGDSGQYLTSVTLKQTFSGYNGLEKYNSLMTFLTSNSSDIRAIPHMIDNNISYVYIGSKPSNYALEYVIRRPFNASQFLATPYFNLTMKVGNAWLFKFDKQSGLETYNATTTTRLLHSVNYR